MGYSEQYNFKIFKLNNKYLVKIAKIKKIIKIIKIIK